VLFLSSCLVLRRGDTASMICIFFGEITNPIQNCWLICKYAHQRGHLRSAALWHLLASALFVALFSVRALYVPFVRPVPNKPPDLQTVSTFMCYSLKRW
jgi:hypothetical protein